MSGNVSEWCFDERPAYSTARRVIRGGSWYYNAYSCRVADRNDNNPTFSGDWIGFRVARSSPP